MILTMKMSVNQKAKSGAAAVGVTAGSKWRAYHNSNLSFPFEDASKPATSATNALASVYVSVSGLAAGALNDRGDANQSLG